MRAGGGKAKGSAFEREACKRLSLWVSGGEREDLFWRSAMSGGRATVRNRKAIDVRQAGDICSVAPEGHCLTDAYYLECKSYKNLQIDRALMLGQGKLAKFWQETKRHAARYKRSPMLIAKQNGMPPLVIIPATNTDFDHLKLFVLRGGFAFYLDDLLNQRDFITWPTSASLSSTATRVRERIRS